jgi:hypothetical protein
VAEQVTPSFEEMIDEAKEATREQLLEEGGEDAIEGWDAMAELWESGKMQEMIESGDYSDLPDSVRPGESDESDS